LRHKATAARPTALKPVHTAPAPAPVDAGPHTVDSLGQQLREVLPTRRLHSVSLCDHEANVLWLSEGALGPDEHALVVEALALLAADTSLPCHEMSLEDGRLALFLPVRAPSAELVGIAMILADGKSVGDDTLERMAAAPVRAIMLRLAVLLKPGETAASASAAPSAPAAMAPQSAPPDLAPIMNAAPPPSLMSPQEVNDILEFDLDPEDGPPVQIPVARPAFSRPAAAAASGETSAEMVSLEFVTDESVAAPPAPPAPPPPPAPPARAARPAQRASAAAAARPAPAAPPAPARIPTVTAALTPVPASPKAPPVAAPAVAAVARAAPLAPVTPIVPATPAAPAAPVIAVAPAPPAAMAAPASNVAVAVPLSTGNDPNLLMEVLPFAKLRAGGQTRRFQVVARTSSAPRDPAAYDALVLQRLLAWLAAHRAAWNSQPTGFTVNLSIATLEDERFAQKIAAALNSHGIAGETLGFEIAEALCTQRRAQVERFITQCEKIGAWIVIDDFSFESQVLPLLRTKAVRLVKIDAKLTSSALKDKLAQAMVVATVQAAKVLGIHCGAKKVDSQAALQWLTAIGCDLAQGAALAGAQSLESLAGSPDPTGLTAMLRPT
jgi:EAL domain-containing protein (putative c-di-GMP-specific phosphodiesterase class I)